VAGRTEHFQASEGLLFSSTAVSVFVPPAIGEWSIFWFRPSSVFDQGIAQDCNGRSHFLG
jgi:hypothetical protein